MPVNGNPHWRQCAIRFAAAGIGSIAAGPLGAALGGWLGGEISTHAERVLEKAGELAGEKLGELGVHFCWDQLKDMKEHPPFEAVVRESLRLALSELKSATSHADWFENWEARLKGSSPITSCLLDGFAEQLSPNQITSRMASMNSHK